MSGSRRGEAAYKRYANEYRYGYRGAIGGREAVMVHDRFARDVRDSIRRETRAQAAAAGQAAIRFKGTVYA